MCGIFSIINAPETQAGNLALLGLHTLQHRGEDSSGLTVISHCQVTSYKKAGTLAELIPDDGQPVPGDHALGHVRYATSKQPAPEYIQPLVSSKGKGESFTTLAFNGNITNLEALDTDPNHNDTTKLMEMFVEDPEPNHAIRLERVLAQVEGAYALVLITEQGMLAARDPHGIRPLLQGKLNGATLHASESVALDIVAATDIIHVKPGTIVFTPYQGGQVTMKIGEPKEQHRCIFENIYFAQPHGKVSDEESSIYQTRIKAGKQLAREHPAPQDAIVVPVPDSGVPAAIGYAREARLPFELGIIRSHFTGRTFILPTEKIRRNRVALKHAPNPDAIRGQSIILIDDSLVRGATTTRLVRILRQHNPRAIHLRIASPPVRYGCYYGIATPDPETLAARNETTYEICKRIGADSLKYLSPKGLLKSSPGSGYCMACFNGDYVVPYDCRTTLEPPLEATSQKTIIETFPRI